MSAKLLHISSYMKKKQLEGFNIGLEISNIVSGIKQNITTRVTKATK